MIPHYVIDEAGCWIWQRAVNCQGYAMIWRDGRSVYAHRVYYADHHGSCPETLDHLCRVRHCVNPDHLEDCSRGENVRRGDVAKTTWEQVAEIRERAERMAGSRRAVARALAGDYPLAVETIRGIIRGRRWPESERPEAVAA